MCRTYLDHGWRVFAGQYMPDWGELSALQERHPDELTILPLDVTDGGSVQAAADAIAERTTSLDIVINNAAIFMERSQTVLDPLFIEDMERIMATNAFGPLRVTHSAMRLPLAGERKLLVNISSEAGSISACWREKDYGYSMSKAALNMQSAILQNHLKPYGVKVLAIHPGWVRSYMEGKLNEKATVEPAESAAGIYRLTQTEMDPDAHMYLDYQGQPLTW